MEKQKEALELRIQYERLLGKVVERRREVERFCRMLEEKTNWLEAPASTRFHLSEPGGLLRHSIGVTKTLLVLRRCIAREIPEESCVIVGLFHDVGKVGIPGKPLYIKNTVEWEIRKLEKLYRVNPALVGMGIAVRSLYLLCKYVSLTEDESQAVVYHDGQYIEENKYIAHKEAALTLLLHWADYWTAHIQEGGVSIWRNQEFFEGPCSEGTDSVQTEIWPSSKQEGGED